MKKVFLSFSLITAIFLGGPAFAMLNESDEENTYVKKNPKPPHKDEEKKLVPYSRDTNVTVTPTLHNPVTHNTFKLENVHITIVVQEPEWKKRFSLLKYFRRAKL